jgi:hypothetical protein
LPYYKKRCTLVKQKQKAFKVLKKASLSLSSLSLFTLGLFIKSILKTNYKYLSIKEKEDKDKVSNIKDLFIYNNRPNTKHLEKASLSNNSIKPSLKLLKVKSLILINNILLINYLKLIINKDNPIDLTTLYNIYITINNILANYIDKITLNKLLNSPAYKDRNNNFFIVKSKN